MRETSTFNKFSMNRKSFRNLIEYSVFSKTLFVLYNKVFEIFLKFF